MMRIYWFSVNIIRVILVATARTSSTL